MNLCNVAKASSGFIDLPAGRKQYSSNISQANRSLVCPQFESAPSGKGSAGLRLRLPLPFWSAFPPSLTLLLDRWGPEEEAIGAGESVFGGTPGTWRDRGQRGHR